MDTADRNSRGMPQYDVALSFAGEDRPYVRIVADELRSAGISVFFDEYEKAKLWGKDLYSRLSEIYRSKSRYTVIFLSQHYARKLWTNHELRSAQEKAFTESQEYILPVLFDDTEISGVLKTVSYIDGRTTSPEELATLIQDKLDQRSFDEEPRETAEAEADRTGYAISVKELLWPLFERIEQIQTREVPGISSGLPQLDKITGGWREQELVVVTGDAANVREFVLHCAFQSAAIESVPTIVASFIESPMMLIQRAVAWGSGIPAKAIRSPKLSDSDFFALATAAAGLSAAPLHFVESSFATSAWLASLRAAIEDHGCRLLVVDGFEELMVHNSVDSLQPNLRSLRKMAENHAISALVALPRPREGSGSHEWMTRLDHIDEVLQVADKIVTLTEASTQFSLTPLIRRVGLCVTEGRYGEDGTQIAINPAGLVFDGDSPQEGWPRGALTTTSAKKPDQRHEAH